MSDINLVLLMIIVTSITTIVGFRIEKRTMFLFIMDGLWILVSLIGMLLDIQIVNTLGCIIGLFLMIILVVTIVENRFPRVHRFWWSGYIIGFLTGFLWITLYNFIIWG